MDVNESINRVKELMGIIVENKHSNTIKKMIDDSGLYNTIKMFGGYSTMLNFIDPQDISDNDKIELIQEVIRTKSNDNEFISIYDLGISPNSIKRIYDQKDNMEKLITSFSHYGVIVNVYKDGRYHTHYAIPYDHMSEEPLNRIFKWMLEFSQNN
jgi:hypothetical protein